MSRSPSRPLSSPLSGPLSSPLSGPLSSPPSSPPSSPTAAGVPGVVLLSRDQALIDHVTALAEAAAAPLVVRGSVIAPGRAAALTLVGPDVAAELPRGRHGGILVVRVDGADPPDGVWRQAV